MCTIETDRLTLRPETPDDAGAVAALWADPAMTRFIGGTPRSAHDSWLRLLRHAGHWALFGYGLFGIVERASGRLVGEVGLAHFRRGLGADFDDAPEAAWVVDPACHGQGYALEAAIHAHRWIDARLGRPRTVCIIDPANDRSVRLATKLGYRAFGERTFEGTPVTVFERVPD